MGWGARVRYHIPCPSNSCENNTSKTPVSDILDDLEPLLQRLSHTLNKSKRRQHRRHSLFSIQGEKFPRLKNEISESERESAPPTKGRRGILKTDVEFVTDYGDEIMLGDKIWLGVRVLSFPQREVESRKKGGEDGEFYRG